MNEFYKGKTILVTGGCGSIGSEIVRKLLEFSPKAIRIMDISEQALFYFQQDLNGHKSLRFLVGDVRDKERLRFAMRKVDIVFHAAALKHVPLCEYNPFEAVKTNILGAQNVVECAREENVEKVVAISTDKAVNPINTMGATKLLAEKIILGGRVGLSKTKYSCVRFGNVLNSSGSVMPIFIKQINNGGPVTITSKEMTRFFMSIGQAVSLVLKAGQISEGDEIFILKMPALKIIDLAEAMIETLCESKKPEIEIIGVRPGEKLHESLISEEESGHITDLGDMYLLKQGYYTPQTVEHGIKRLLPMHEYRSDRADILKKDEIKEMLLKPWILHLQTKNLNDL